MGKYIFTLALRVSMRRKVLKVGNASLAVSLPSAWAKQHQLTPGAEVTVTENGGQLTIGTTTERSSGSVSVTLPPAKQFARRLILSPYIQGATTIELHYEDPKVRPLIDDALSYMMGFELIEQRAKSCTLTNVARGIEEEFPAMYTRLFHIVRTMLDSLAQRQLTELPAYARMADNLHLFLRRLLNTRVSWETKRITVAYRTVCMLEETSDSILHASRDTLPKDLTPIKDILALHNAFHALSTKPTPAALAAFKHQCIGLQKRFVKTRFDQRLWEIVERYRTITEEILF